MSGQLYLELPSGITSVQQLVDILNDRFRDLTEQAAAGNQDLGGFRIINLGDAQQATDALNMRTADARYQKASSSTSTSSGPIAPTTPTATSSINQLILSIPGTLAVQSNAAALVTLPVAFTAKTAVMIGKQAPSGGTLTFQVSANGKLLGTVSAADGSTSSTTSVTWTIPKGQVVTVDVTSVGGQGSSGFPGADWTLELQA